MGFFKKLGTMISGKEDAVKPKAEKVGLKDLGIEIEVSLNDSVQVGENKIIAIPSAYHREFEEYPEFIELYAKTVFLNALSDMSPIKNPENYQHYLKYECRINDPVAYHKQMINEGYLARPSYEQILKSKKVTELKEILSNMGLVKSGTKDVLIKRIIESSSDQQANNVMDDCEGYTLSQKGILFLEETDDYLKLHRSKGYSIGVNEYEYNKRNLADGSSYNDIVLYTLREHIKRASPAIEPSYIRGAYLNYAQFQDQLGNEAESLYNYLVVLYLDTSGTMQYNSISLQKQLKEIDIEFMERSARLMMVFPGIAIPIHDIQNSYTENMVDEIFENIKLPVNILTKDDFKVIINEIMSNKDYDEDKINKILYEKFMEYVNESLGGN